jgi:hypothetical protein
MALKHIAEGWFNSFLSSINMLDESMKKLGETRASICINCPVRTEHLCDSQKSHRDKTGKTFNGCGCHIHAKVLCEGCQCPGGFW